MEGRTDALVKAAMEERPHKALIPGEDWGRSVLLISELGFHPGVPHFWQ
jgi:hypothetical protein